MPPAPVTFEVAPAPFDAVHHLAEALGVSRTLAQVLVRRGLADPAAARRFLAAADAHPPSTFGGLAEAARLITGYTAARSRITVHGDYDVDGVCATAILIRALRTLGADVDWYLPSRMEDGYGLSAGTVERLAARGTELLITADCAITAVDEVAAARAAGLDVVVTDHHAPRADGSLPDAPIVHPSLGGYPCPELCAAGVAHKLAGALLAAAGHPPALADDDLDLVALATVADVVPLVGENRRLVREGLRRLARTQKPGLRALMAVARVDPSGLDAQAIGFRLAPRINAAGRLYRADAGLELVLTDDLERARQIAEELDAVNTERRDVETRIRFEAEAMVREMRAGAGVDPPAYVLASEDWHPGVIGIVASRIAERFHRPTVLIALDGEVGSGSGRSIPGFDLLAGLTAASDELERYGGHRAAAGCTIARARVPAFREAFCAHAARTLTPELLTRRERIDAVVPGDALGLGLAEELERLEPIGAGNPAVSLLVCAARCDDPRPMGEGRHLTFTLAAGGARSRCVSFGQGASLPAEPGHPVDAAVRLEVNRYNGAVEPRLVLRAVSAPAARAVEVIGEPECFADGLLAELDRELSPTPAEEPGRGLGSSGVAELAAARVRERHDHRGRGIAGLIGELVATSEPVLVLAAHAGHRAQALRGRVGGFALASYLALEDQPLLASPFSHVVALDPPAAARVPRTEGSGHLHLAWGKPELAFARSVHEWNYALRAPLTEVYRDLRTVGTVSGPALEALLRGTGPQPRSAALAGRLVRVLTELGLARLDRGTGLALSLAAAPARTELERSPAFRAYHVRCEDGLRWLTPEPVAPATRAA